MADPTRLLTERLQVGFDRLEPGADPVLRQSERADYQANGTLALAKRLGRPPREVADEIVASSPLEDLCETVEVSGPGFINLVLSSSFLAAQVSAMAGDDRLGNERVERRCPTCISLATLGPE